MQTKQRKWLNKPDLTVIRGALFVLLTLVGGLCQASPEPPPPFVIHSLPDQARITIYSEYLRAPSGDLDIDTVSRPPATARFQPATRYIERLGIRNGHWWVRVAIKNELGNRHDFALHLRGHPAATLYLPDSNGQYQQLTPEQRIPGRGTAYRIHLPTGQTRVAYLQLEPRAYLTYGLTLTTTNRLLESQQNQNAIYLLLAGALLTLALYNLIAAIMRGGATYYYHCAFIISVLLIGLILADFPPDLLSTDPLLQPRLLFAGLMLSMWSAAGLSRCFFNQTEPTGWLHRTTHLLQIAALANLPFTVLLPVAAAGYISFAMVAATALFLLALGYAAWHREITGGGLFFFTSLLITIPAILICLACLGLLQTDTELPQWLLAATMMEAVTLGIGLRMQHSQKTRLRIEKKRSQAIAETVDSTRRETLSRIGHDIRTPLSGILGMAEILSDTPLTPNQRECVGAIQNAGDNLLRIINDVLEHSHLSTQGTDINHSTLDINDLIMEAIDLFKEKAEEKQIELITHVHTNVPTRVIGDAGRLRQILTNLMGALVRHGSHGELIVDVSMEPTGQADRVRFGFSGSAVSDDTLQRLRGTASQPESSHLSLAIAEQLVEALQGRMGTLQDQRGAHYWFVVPLPAETSEAPPPITVDTSALEGRSLLVVDDSSTVTRVLRHHALSWGMRVTASHDPREALATLRT